MVVNYYAGDTWYVREIGDLHVQREIAITQAMPRVERNDRRNIKLTDAGQSLRNRAEQILALVDQTVTELRVVSRNLSGNI